MSFYTRKGQPEPKKKKKFLAILLSLSSDWGMQEVFGKPVSAVVSKTVFLVLTLHGLIVTDSMQTLTNPINSGATIYWIVWILYFTHATYSSVSRFSSNSTLSVSLHARLLCFVHHKCYRSMYSCIQGQKVPIHAIPSVAMATTEAKNIQVFTNFRRVSICLMNRPIRFCFLRLRMLQRSFEYAWGNVSFSQSNIIKIAHVQSHFIMVCELWFPRFCAPYTRAGLRQSCMQTKVKFDSF